MPPPTMQQRYAGVNNPPSHHQYPTYTQPGLPPPSVASAGNYMSGPSMNPNPFANGNNSLNIGGNFGRPGPGMPGDTGLGSQHVMNSFAAAGMHQHQNGMVESGQRGAANKHRIRDVWAHNLDEEMRLIRILAEYYPYIATHTIFPGIVARPMGNFNGKSDYHYQCMRCNVDLLKMLQLGITPFDEEGNTLPTTLTSPDVPAELAREIARQLPKHYHNLPLPTTWQFHFKFSRLEDMYSEVALTSWMQAGIEIERLATDGIDPGIFASTMMTSGLICDDDVHWLTNHAVYDLGYLLKVLSDEELPDDENQFQAIMSKYFPSIYDIKFVIKEGVRKHHAREITPIDPNTHELLAKLEQKTQLDSLVDTFKIKRFGGNLSGSNTAGVACMYTGKVFFKLRSHLFNEETPREIDGHMWGIGQYSHGLSPEKHQTPPQHHNYNENERPGANGYTNGGPSTPNTGNAGLVHTPQHSNGGMGPMTPGGVGGAPFSMGAFTYGNK